MLVSRITHTIGRAFVTAGTNYIRATRPDILVYSSEEYRYTRWLKVHAATRETSIPDGPSSGMMCWKVDLSRAAEEYGLDHVPAVKPDLDPYQADLYVAGFRVEDWSIHTGEGFFDLDLTDDYSESRFTGAGAPVLDNLDAHRFILAHELWHARQHELYGDRVHLFTLLEMLGIVDHDDEPTERQADLKAAEVYGLVDIIPWQDRRTQFEQDQSAANEREERIRAYLQARLAEREGQR